MFNIKKMNKIIIFSFILVILSISSYAAVTQLYGVNLNIAKTYVSFTIPYKGQTDININSNISAKFLIPMNKETFNSSTIRLRDENNNYVSGKIYYDNSTYTIIFDPKNNMDNNKIYTAIIGDVLDLEKNNYDTYAWSFTTCNEKHTTQPEEPISCIHAWTCNSWDDCTPEGTKTRSCRYIGNCQDHNDNPFPTEITCTYAQPSEEQKDNNSKSKEKNRFNKNEAIKKQKHLFDIISEMLKIDNTEGDLTAKITLINFGVPGKANVTINYKIKDINNNTIISQTEYIILETQTELIKTFELPDNIKDGEYILSLKLLYGNNQEAVAENMFSIKKVITREFESSYEWLEIPAVIIMIVVLIMMILKGIRKL